MAYGLKYTMQVQAKTEPNQIIYTCHIYEKDYLGDTYEFSPAANPITCQVLAASDDQFDPIVTKTFTLLVDITDFTHDLPDFATTDDRKYHVKIYGLGTTYLAFQGFILMDQVTIPFTTGRTFLQMVCVDGLAMLKNINYTPSNVDINVLEDLSTTIINCLNKIQLPDGYNINYVCDYFASSMNLSISPYKQSFLPSRNYLSSDGHTYINCYEVLQKIVNGFGARIFQSNGEYWVSSINDNANTQIRYFATNNLNVSETIVTRWKNIEVKPYQDVTTTPWYFQDNVQFKILRKGYPYLHFYDEYSYASNIITDPLLKQTVLGLYWVMGHSGSGSNIIVQEWVPAKMNAFTLIRGSGFAQVAPIGLPVVPYGEIIELAFDIFQSELTGGNRLIVKMTIDDGTGTDWYLDVNGDWSKAPSLNYYIVGAYTGTSSANSQERITIKTPPIPAAGQLTLYMRTDSGTMSNLIFGNFKMTLSSQYERYDIRNFNPDTDTISYKKDVQISIGLPNPSDVNKTLNGVLVDADNNILFDWTKEGSATVYPYLASLIYQQYYNIISSAQKNFNCTIRNLFDTRSNVGPIIKQYPHIIDMIDSVSVEDTTTNSLSVNGYYYIIGAAEYNYVDDTINATILYVSNTDISVTQTLTITYKNP